MFSSLRASGTVLSYQVILDRPHHLHRGPEDGIRGRVRVECTRPLSSFKPTSSSSSSSSSSGATTSHEQQSSSVTNNNNNNIIVTASLHGRIKTFWSGQGHGGGTWQTIPLFSTCPQELSSSSSSSSSGESAAAAAVSFSSHQSQTQTQEDYPFLLHVPRCLDDDAKAALSRRQWPPHTDFGIDKSQPCPPSIKDKNITIQYWVEGEVRRRHLPEPEKEEGIWVVQGTTTTGKGKGKKKKEEEKEEKVTIKRISQDKASRSIEYDGACSPLWCPRVYPERRVEILGHFAFKDKGGGDRSKSSASSSSSSSLVKSLRGLAFLSEHQHQQQQQQQQVRFEWKISTPTQVRRDEPIRLLIYVRPEEEEEEVGGEEDGEKRRRRRKVRLLSTSLDIYRLVKARTWDPSKRVYEGRHHAAGGALVFDNEQQQEEEEEEEEEEERRGKKKAFERWNNWTQEVTLPAATTTRSLASDVRYNFAVRVGYAVKFRIRVLVGGGGGGVGKEVEFKYEMEGFKIHPPAVEEEGEEDTSGGGYEGFANENRDGDVPPPSYEEVWEEGQ